MTPKGHSIRPYALADETPWVRCRAIAFLDSAYFDDVEQSKPRYEFPAIELVAKDSGGAVIGFIDVECEETPGTVCSNRLGLGGMIWNIGVHPDHRRRGVASVLLASAIDVASQRGLVRLEAWTRDDPSALAWYRSQGFHLMDSYLHVCLDASETKANLSSPVSGLVPIRALAHYRMESGCDAVRSKFRRVHECQLFERRLDVGWPGVADGDE